jgi:3',5'-cyclic-AMP phosphodiesterase
MRFTRRQFGRLAAATAGATLIRQLWAESSLSPASRTIRFAAIADTHIIDEFYKGPENSPEDTESIFHSKERLTSARDFINSLKPGVEKVFLIGDYFHNYPSPDYDFYFSHTTRLDQAKAITDGFNIPVHIGFGNHDYDVPEVSRQVSHKLFQQKFNTRPYYSIDYRGVKFVHLNNFLGATWDKSSPQYNKTFGSMGEEQLNWFETELHQQRPTFVFTHFPLFLVRPTEFSEYGVYSLLQKYKNNIPLMLSGHVHKWIDFGHTFGPQHYAIAATRYDPNAYMLVEYDSALHKVRFLNSELVQWGTHYSRPYKAQVAE